MINPANTAWESAPRSRFAILLLAALLLAVAAAITPAHGAACPDADLDGYADCTVPGCDPAGLLCGDCDDGRNGVHPGVAESCDQLDNDCDGLADEGFPVVTTSRELRDPGAAGGDGFGRAVAAIGDVDGDGIDDFVVGAPYDELGAATEAGSVGLFSGRTHALLCRATDPEGLANDYLGWSATGTGDINHDGTSDFAAGVLYDDTGQGTNTGSVVVFSGANCARLLKLVDTGGASSDYLGAAVAGIGDVDHDGTPDLAAGAYYDDTGSATDAGSVVLFSGGSGAVIRRLTDPLGASSDHLGGAVALAGDLNRDGTPDIAAGAEGDDDAGADRGSVLVFSGADGAVLLRLTDPTGTNYEHLGGSVAAMGDLDHDGTPDLAVGAPENGTLASNAGRIVVFSGRTGAALARWTDAAGAAGDRLGRSVAAIGDLDGDGTVDLAAGEP
nr:MopE-related protein [Acidobacteriota bacterium]